MRVALDTNILVYALGINDAERRARAEDVIAAIPEANLVISAQVLGELFRVLVGKRRWSRVEARASIHKWQAAASVTPTTPAALTAALDLATDHGLTIWDAVIVNAAAEAGCRLLLSEDLQHGFVWRGVTVVDPFRPERHPLLAAALGG